MIKNITFILCIITFSVAGLYSQTCKLLPNGDTINLIDSQGLKQGLWIEDAEGLLDEENMYYMEAHKFYVDGLEEGMQKYYLKETGKLIMEIYMEEGKWNGVLRFYYKDGTLREEGYYKEYKKDSIERRYYPDGQLGSEYSYNNGIKEGPFITYYSNGNINRQGTYHKGELNDMYKTHYRSGELYEEVTYFAGEREGIRKVYYKNGKIKRIIPYKKGYTNGIRKEYNEKGILIEELFFDMGELNKKKIYDQELLQETIYKK